MQFERSSNVHNLSPLFNLLFDGRRLALVSCAQNAMGGSNTMGNSNTTSGLSPADKRFVKEAAQGGMAEVELGQLAVQKASSDDVKKFGQRMVDDHTKANDKLKEVASSEGITLPQGLNAKDEATKDRLSSCRRSV